KVADFGRVVNFIPARLGHLSPGGHDQLYPGVNNDEESVFIVMNLDGKNRLFILTKFQFVFAI
ncbi:hypothetical protein, partial [Proteiniphilum sp. UBA5480]|uniref:hypothetical protein n=1 Tax=Proteiniphilum sp. UBA5480 TaxID=1947282 RepID=UPI00257B068D